MLLLVEIGNTTLGIGLASGDKVVFLGTIPTDKQASVEHYQLRLREVIVESPLATGEAHDGYLSSVVPELNETVLEAMQCVVRGKVTLIEREDIERHLPLAIEHPETVGKDRLLDCVGALTLAKGPLVVFDLGTATTLNAIDKEGRYIGGMIIPGVQTSVKALSQRASLLPQIELAEPAHLLGQNTVECMQSGAVYGAAAMVDGLIEYVTDHLGDEVEVVATGGCGRLVVPHCRHKIKYDPYLQLKGLAQVARSSEL